MAAAAVIILGLIIIWDAYWLTKQKRDVPTLGRLAGGYAWQSEGSHEVIRQWGNLGSMAAMMVLPWGLISLSDTSFYYAIIWDVFLALHLISLLVPKRYAVSRTHLFADGQKYAWSRLRLAKRQPNRRIMLLRQGWGIFGPLPVGVDAKQITEVRSWIAAALIDDDGKAWQEKIGNSEEE